jgi:TPP-dependent pyruvate/acetoin dehydrogenase alpha subunit
LRRYAAFDPPEYLDWKPDSKVLRGYRDRLLESEERREIVESLEPDSLLDLYRGLIRFRLHDIMLQRWVKQGVISKAWLGTGEEAVTVGVVHALRRGAPGETDVCGPMIRNAGACHEMGMPLEAMFRGYLGTRDGPARGRDIHIGDPDFGVVAPVSVVGGLCCVINGYALAFQLRGSERVALTWIGDGSTKSGEVHEALNFAAVNHLPAVFVLQNNQVALGTRLSQHHKAERFRDWGRAYGVELLEADGNNVLDMYAAGRLAVDRCRRGDGPVFIAAETFRMGGHATHDVREARGLLPPELFATWGQRDPVGLYEEFLATGPWELASEAAEGSVGADSEREDRNRRVLSDIESELAAEVDAAAGKALESRDRETIATTEDTDADVYA